MDSENAERLHNELSLLEAMYPGQITFKPKDREVRYVNGTASLSLRIPTGYPKTALPEVISANAFDKTDLRHSLVTQGGRGGRGGGGGQGLALLGEEALDSMIAAFDDLNHGAQSKSSRQHNKHVISNSEPSKAASSGQEEREASSCKTSTVVIWLHHLLNTAKRKKCLASHVPSLDAISGVSKPGYPGVLIYSGPSSLVHSHVDALKQLHWAAFQVRLDEEEEGGDEWRFEHGRGVIEVESMKEVVREIVGEERKRVFLAAMRMK